MNNFIFLMVSKKQAILLEKLDSEPMFIDITVTISQELTFKGSANALLGQQISQAYMQP
jgi:hypothetical protein